jgi:hypothetical protein
MNSQLSPVRRSLGEGGAFNSQPSVELHIEELVLDGFVPGERYGISDAVERELARLVGQQGIPSSLRSESAIDEIKGATFNAAHNAKPPALGRHIAHAVYQGFGG